MSTDNQITIVNATDEQRRQVTGLLQSEDLPIEDLPASLDNFLVALLDGKVIGVTGLEQYGNEALLRSMAVDKQYRNKSIASQLLQRLEKSAITKGICSMYLLTETASQYFERKGYKKITREEVPKSLLASSEFSHVCPVSAIVMQKTISAPTQL